MQRKLSMVVALGLGLVPLASGAVAAGDDAPRRPAPVVVPEPPGLYHGNLHGQTPTSLAGADVIDAPTVEKLVREHAVIIDVANADHRPPGQPTDLPWTPIHRSVPGATWMPGAGSGTEDPAFEKAYAARLQALTGGDKDKPVLTFCHPARWGSWNAAKRATMLGYRHVYWFPKGAEGWQGYGKAQDVEPDARWSAAFKALPVKPTDVPPQ